MYYDLLIDPEPEVIPRHRRRRLAFDIQSERIATMKCATAIQPDLLMSPSPSVQAVQRFLERCQRCRPVVENLKRVSKNLIYES